MWWRGGGLYNFRAYMTMTSYTNIAIPVSSHELFSAALPMKKYAYSCTYVRCLAKFWRTKAKAMRQLTIELTITILQPSIFSSLRGEEKLDKKGQSYSTFY